MITNEEYVQGVLRTEAPVTPELIERVAANAATTRGILNFVVSATQAVDQLKKLLFYNKPFGLYDTLFTPVTEPQALVRLRDRDNIRLLHAALGLYTEAVEVIEQLYGHIFEGKDLDAVNLIEEGGDHFWYLGILANTLQTTFEDMQTRNNRKLRARYPEKFAERNAVERDLAKEREELL